MCRFPLCAALIVLHIVPKNICVNTFLGHNQPTPQFGLKSSFSSCGAESAMYVLNMTPTNTAVLSPPSLPLLLRKVVEGREGTGGIEGMSRGEGSFIFPTYPVLKPFPATSLISR